jgi:hypothetical protein
MMRRRLLLGSALSSLLVPSSAYARFPRAGVAPASGGGSDFPPGIYFPSSITITQDNVQCGWSMGSGFVRGLSGIVTFSVDGAIYIPTGQPLASMTNNMLTMPCYGYAGADAGVYSSTITATDGSGSYSQTIPVTVLAPGQNYAWIGGNVLTDNQPSLPAQFPDRVYVQGTGAVTLNDPSGHFDIVVFGSEPSRGAQIVTKSAVTDLTAIVGAYLVTITVGGDTSAQQPLWVVHEQPPVVQFIPALTVYDNTPASTVLGTFKYYDEDFTGVLSLTTNPGGAFFINPNGSIDPSLAQLKNLTTLSAGVKNLVALVTDGALSTSFPFSITVGAGTNLPSGNLSFTPSSSLDNYLMTQSIGTPSVSGMTATHWTCSTPDDYPETLGLFGTPVLPFTCDPTTGAITATGMLSATDGWMHGRSAYQLTITAMDNAGTRCTNTFAVNVAHKVGPTYWVGQGMVAAHGANGFEHIADLEPRFNSFPVSGSVAGATINIVYNADPDYYADDLAFSNAGWFGPFKIQNSDTTGPRPRVGGLIGSVLNSGSEAGKGFFNIQHGDVIITGLEISFVHGDVFHGVSGIRKNAESWGDIWEDNCYIHDCDQGLQSGDGSINTVMTNCEHYGAGTETVSAGNTHAVYCGDCANFIMDNCLMWGTMQGHNVKTRAYKFSITNSRIYDSERGSASAQIDVAEGGIGTIDGCDIQKGPNAQGPWAIAICSNVFPTVGYLPDRITDVTISNCRFDIMTPSGNHWETAWGVGIYGVTNPVNNATPIVNLTTNSWYLAPVPAFIPPSPDPPGEWKKETNYPVSPGSTVNETGSTTLTGAFALSFTDPGTATPPASRPGFLSNIYDGDSFNNFTDTQQDPGNDDIRVANGLAAGTTIATITPYGSGVSVPPNPFGAGTTWSIIQNPMYLSWYIPWAPVGRYAITSNSDGTATLKVGTSALPSTPGFDYIQLRATGPTAVLSDWRFYIVLV